MGTQQILLIVLSVIIVGAAVAVGIQMFNSQGASSARSACIMDMNNFAAMAIAWYKTPLSLGGAGGTVSTTATDPNGLDALGNYLSSKYDATTTSIKNDNGVYVIATTADALTITSKATGYTTTVTPSLQLTYATGGIVVHPDGAAF